MGIIVAGTGIGGIIYPIMFTRLLNSLCESLLSAENMLLSDFKLTYAAFRDTLLVMAAINFILTFPTIFIARGRLPPKILPPWKIVKEPFKDKAYTFLDLGVGIVALK